MPLRHSYPLTCAPLLARQHQHDVSWAERVPAVGLAFSPNATSLAVASCDALVRVLKLPVSRHRHSASKEPGGCLTLVGHTERLHSVAYSHDGSMVVSSSADRSVRVWSIDGRQDACTLLLDRVNRHTSSPSQRSKDRPTAKPEAANNRNPLIEAECRGAAFFYMDRFLLVASGGNLRQYSYEVADKISSTKQKGVEAAAAAAVSEERGRYRLAQAWGPQQLGGIAVTSFTCCNAMLSPLVVAAASNRSLLLVDAATGSVARTIPDAHERAAHTVCLPSPSPFVALDSAHYDIFLSAASDGCIALWDIRANRVSMRLRGGHVNRREHGVAVALSPCIRYVAAGSEERRPCLYDLRSGSHLPPVSGKGHGEAAVAVAFNPAHPQWASAAHDGSVHFYTAAATTEEGN